MVFAPKLASGETAPLPWQIKLFYILDITWPSDDQDKILLKRIINIKNYVTLFCYTYIMYLFLQYAYIYLASKDIGLTVACIAYFLNLIEVFLRSIVLLVKMNEFKSTLAEFYGQIYLERVQNVEVQRYMDRHLWPTKMSSYCLSLTMVCFWAIPIYSLWNGLTILPFPIGFFYDYTKTHLYILTSLFLCWNATILGTHLIAESNMIATFIAHLNGRYLLLQEEIQQVYENQNKRLSESDVPCEDFRIKLKTFYLRSEELNRFAQKIQDLYSLIFFIILMNNVFMLCVLSFKIATAESFSDAASYVFWLLSKIIDLLIIGKLGSSFADTTNNMSYAYYSCNWELLTAKDHKSEDNTKLLKFIHMTISLSQKPLTLNGLNFFNVNLEVVLAILKGAASYFAFLYNFRE